MQLAGDLLPHRRVRAADGHRRVRSRLMTGDGHDGMLSFVNPQHQNLTNPLVAKVWRLVEKCLAGHNDLVG